MASHLGEVPRSSGGGSAFSPLSIFAVIRRGFTIERQQGANGEVLACLCLHRAAGTGECSAQGGWGSFSGVPRRSPHTASSTMPISAAPIPSHCVRDKRSFNTIHASSTVAPGYRELITAETSSRPM